MSPGRLRILHLIVRVGPPNAQYNEHCLPMTEERELAICSVFEPTVIPPPSIALFSGDGTVRGFRRALARALDQWPHDVVHAHAQVTGVLLIAVSLLRGRSLRDAVYTVHNSFQNYGLRNRLLLFPIFALFPTNVVCSEAALASLPRPLRWLGRRKTHVVRNAVDVGRVDRVLGGGPRRPVDGRFRIISVSRLIDVKNPHTVLRAFARRSDPGGSLVYIGQGDLGPDLAGRAEAWGLGDRVTFTGLIPREDVYRWVADSDLFVSASRGEGLPVAVLEAMACGRPVVLSDIPPHREVVGDADHVPLVPADDVESFAAEMERFRRMAPAERAEIGRRCRELVERRFGLAGMHRLYERIYAGVRTASGNGATRAREGVRG